MILSLTSLGIGQTITVLGVTLSNSQPSATIPTSTLMQAFRRSGQFTPISNTDYQNLFVFLNRGLVQLQQGPFTITTGQQLDTFIDSSYGMTGTVEPIDNPTDLTAQVNDSALPQWTQIFVGSAQKQFYLDKTSTLTPDGVTVIITQTGVGRWLVGGSGGGGGLPNSSWLVSDWFVDPVNGNDNNSGLTESVPVKTVMGGIVTKWGTRSPVLAQATCIHLLNGMPLATAGGESIVLEPRMVGDLSTFAIIGVPLVLSTFTLGAVTPRYRGPGNGHPLRVASFPGIPGGVPLGQTYILNTTRGSRSRLYNLGTYGAGVAELAQPMQVVTLAEQTIYYIPPYDDTWSEGDTVQLCQLPNINLNVLAVRGGASTSTDTGGLTYVQYISIIDPGGTAGYSTFYPSSPDQITFFYDCYIGPYVESSHGSLGTISTSYGNCALDGGVELNWAGVNGGWISGYGCDMTGYGGLDGGVLCRGQVDVGQVNFIGDIFLDVNETPPGVAQTGLFVFGRGSQVRFEPVNYGVAFIWARDVTYPLQLTSGSNFFNESGQTYANSVFLTELLFENYVGTAYVNGEWINDILITAANIDAYNGLQSPVFGTSFTTTLTTGTQPTNPALLVTDWYVDPVHGIDSSNGLSTGQPVKTIMGGIVTKWGTNSPVLAQNTTIHLMNSETVGQEYVVLQPICVDGATFEIDGTLGRTLIGTFNLGTVTPKVRTGGGTLLGAGGFSHSGLAVGQVVVNNVTNSHSLIQNLSGTNATLAQPLVHLPPTFTPAPAEDDTWTTGQSVSVYSLPILNLKVLSPTGQDDNVANTFQSVWVESIRIPDASGTVGNSSFVPNISSTVINFQDCVFDAYLIINNGIYTHHGSHFPNCGFNAGASVGYGSIQGGYSALFPIELNDWGDIDLDHIAAAGVAPGGAPALVGYCYVPAGQQLFVYPCTSWILDDQLNGTVGAGLYGGASLTIGANAFFGQRSGSTWAARLLLTGGLFLVDENGSSLSTGTSYTPGTPGVFNDGINLTQANLDTYGALFNPRTNARFSFANSSL
jgi:hypothetical protein